MVYEGTSRALAMADASESAIGEGEAPILLDGTKCEVRQKNPLLRRARVLDARLENTNNFGPGPFSVTGFGF